MGDPESRDATVLRIQIATGARTALEEQYWDVLEKTVQARPADARLGGDPSIANHVRAFLLLRYYRGGEWQERIEVGIFYSYILQLLINCSNFSLLDPNRYGQSCFT